VQSGMRRPRRADARRNFDALLVAARDAFAERGSGASLEEIARRAGVGIGTLYRNFPTRQDLLDAVYGDEIDALCRAAGDEAGPDPWTALAAWLHRFAGYLATRRAVHEEINRGAPALGGAREAIRAAAGPLLTRAQQAGAARRDVSADDLLRLVAGLAAGGYADDTQRERVLSVALDGVRAR
jgi:AcrR family transcriptional regulator